MLIIRYSLFIFNLMSILLEKERDNERDTKLRNERIKKCINKYLTDSNSVSSLNSSTTINSQNNDDRSRSSSSNGSRKVCQCYDDLSETQQQQNTSDALEQ